MRIRNFKGIAYGVSANPVDPTKITDEWGIDLSPSKTGGILTALVLGIGGWMLVTGKFSGNAKSTGVINPAYSGADEKGMGTLLVLLAAGAVAYTMSKSKSSAIEPYIPATADQMANTILRGQRITMTRPK